MRARREWRRLCLLAIVLLQCMIRASSLSTMAADPKNIVVVGGGIQGISVAYYLAQMAPSTTAITILEAKTIASAASGKGGGFMARSWGDGGPTQRLHQLAFDLYAELAPQLGCTTYRTLPVLSVSPGKRQNGVQQARQQLGAIIPSWLDGIVDRISLLGAGDDTAQVTPTDFCECMLRAVADRVRVVTDAICVGVETELSAAAQKDRQVTAVKYTTTTRSNTPQSLPCDAVVVAAGPWSCAAEDWFPNSNLRLPMEGVKSTSIVWKAPASGQDVDATALFCGEHSKFHTHLEVYPRPDGTVYLCGIGGSDYISTAELKQGAFLEQCHANEARVQAAMDAFREMSPAYADAEQLDRTQACMRPCPPDALPYMGAIPGYQGAYINAGHNCWGIAWAPACGKAMAELVLGGLATSVDLSPFDPARFTAHQSSGRGRKKQSQSVGEQW